MRRGLLVVLATLIVGSLIAQAAGGRTTAVAAAALHSIKEKIAVPGPGSSSVVEFTIEATATNGDARAPKVQLLDEAQLPPGIRAIAVVSPRHAHARHARFKVYIAINNLTPRSARDAHTSAVDNVKIRIYSFFGEDELPTETKDLAFPQDCTFLVGLGQSADPPAVVTLDPLDLRNTSPEQALDHIVFNNCANFGAEPPEANELSPV